MDAGTSASKSHSRGRRVRRDCLSARLTANSIFHKYQVDKRYVTQGEYTNHGVGHYNQRNVQLSLSYAFGSSNTRVKQTEKTVENDDLVGGLRSGN